LFYTRDVGSSQVTPLVGAGQFHDDEAPMSALLVGLLLTVAGFVVALVAIFVVLMVAPVFMPPHAPTTPP
jgi:hypothetical protein